jgi:hypothetical protein
MQFLFRPLSPGTEETAADKHGSGPLISRSRLHKRDKAEGAQFESVSRYKIVMRNLRNIILKITQKCGDREIKARIYTSLTAFLACFEL